jgi:hypothetical protein
MTITLILLVLGLVLLVLHAAGRPVPLWAAVLCLFLLHLLPVLRV